MNRVVQLSIVGFSIVIHLILQWVYSKLSKSESKQLLSVHMLLRNSILTGVSVIAAVLISSKVNVVSSTVEAYTTPPAF